MPKSAEQLKRESIETFERVAETYDRSLYAVHSSRLYRAIIAELDTIEFDSVIDVACGTGALLTLISRRSNARLAGIDISTEMIAASKEKLDGRAELVVGDAENLPWDDNTFDAVVSSNSFHHFPRPQVALAEMKRVLRPGGTLIIGDAWLPTPFRQPFNLMLPFFRTGDVHIYSKREMMSLLDESGFKVISWRRVGVLASIVTASK